MERHLINILICKKGIPASIIHIKSTEREREIYLTPDKPGCRIYLSEAGQVRALAVYV